MKLHQKIFLVLLFFLPSQLGYHFWPQWAFVFGIKVDYLAPTIFFTDILVAALIAFWLKEVKKANFISLFRKYKYWIVSLLLFSAVNIALSISWQVSTYKWIKLMEFILLAVYTKTSWNQLKEKVVRPLVFALLTQALLVIIQLITQKTSGNIFWFLGERRFSVSTPGIALMDFFGLSLLRPYGTFSHPNSLAGFALASCALLVLLKKDLKVLVFGLYNIGIGVSILLVAVSYSQLTWIGLVLFLVTYSLRARLTRNLKYIMAFFVFVSLLLPFISMVFLDFNFPENISKRLELNVFAKNIFFAYPLVGVGLGNFVKVVESQLQNVFLFPQPIWSFQPVHNLILLFVSEVGLVGLLILLMYVFRNFKSKGVYVLLLIPILLTGMGDHYWLTLQQNYLLFGIVLGIISAKIHTSK